METETLACESAVRSLEAKVAQIPPSGECLKLKEKATVLQEGFIHLGSENLPISQNLDAMQT